MSDKLKRLFIPGIVDAYIEVDEDMVASAVAEYLREHPVSITVDSELSGTSENPVQNNVIKLALDQKGTYSKPSGGIPKSDLAQDVQTSLGKADTALQDGANITNNLGFCYVNVGAGQTETALVGTNANYVPKNGGIVVGRFLVDVPANATINISGKGSKTVYFRNAAISAGIIKAGDVAAFVYYPERYYLIAIDRWQTDIEAIQNAGYQTAQDVQTAISGVRQLPAVTASDNGKFLRVVNGAWAAQTVPSAEGASF